MKKFTLILSIALALSPLSYGSAFSIGGVLEEETLKDSNGITLASTSIIQVGYFNGIDANLSPSLYTQSQWNTFTPISGIDSSNPTKLTQVEDTAYGVGTYDISLNYDSNDGDTTPTLPVRIGFRFYDSTTSTASAQYNTASSSTSAWNLRTFNALDPGSGHGDISIIDGSDAGLSWQAGGSDAFKTTISAVPEPSSFALLGLGGMALLFRRRK